MPSFRCQAAKFSFRNLVFGPRRPAIATTMYGIDWKCRPQLSAKAGKVGRDRCWRDANFRRYSIFSQAPTGKIGDGEKDSGFSRCEVEYLPLRSCMAGPD